MARRSRSRRDADTFDIANSPTFNQLSYELSRPVILPDRPVTKIDEFLGDSLPYDRRVFSFGEQEGYGLSIAGTQSEAGPMSKNIQFSDPSLVSICHRREVRKEVMIAKRRKGRGGSRRSWRSEIKC